MKNNIKYFPWVGVLFLSMLAILPFIGVISISPPDIFGNSPDDQLGFIFWQIRVPRVLLACIVGAGLSVGGLVVQAVLQNPLATPYTLGITSGSALGAVIAIKLGMDWIIGGFSSLIVFSFVGALLTAWIIFLVAARMKRFSSYVLILAGITLAYALGAVTLFVQFFADWVETRQMVHWFMGGLQPVGYNQLLISAAITIPAILYIWRYGRELNILNLGEDLAQTKGVAVVKLTRNLFIAVAMIIAIIVSIAGPIGFVGIIIPHLLRLWLGSDNTVLIPMAVITGAIFLMISDTISRVIIAPAELPVGIITAIIGAFFFIVLLFRKRFEIFA